MKEKDMRMVKIFIQIEGSLGMALKKSLEIFDIKIVDGPQEAHLIIAGNHSAVGSLYSKDKWFAIFSLDKVTQTLPENVFYIPAMDSLVGCLNVIAEVSEKISDNEAAEEKSEPPMDFLPDAKKILVIEDTLRHQKSAKLLLKGHHLTIATGYDEAMEILGKEKFEIVLSDLYLPMSPKTLGDKAFKIGKLVQYGLLLSLEAARCGAKFVAVATNLNHHADCFSAAFDHYSRFDFNINGAKVKYMHAPMIKNDGEEEYVKDWAAAMRYLLS